MHFYDYCVLADSDLDRLANMANELSWSGLCLLSQNVKSKGKGKLDLVNGIIIETENASVVKKQSKNNRKKAEIVVVRGLNDEVNRAAVETKEVDVLLPNPDTRIDYVMAKLAREKDVKIGFEFRLLLHSCREERSRIFSRMKENAKLVKKFKAPFVLTSGAMEAHDLRAPSEMIAFGKVLGLEEPNISESLSAKMIEQNRLKLSEKWVARGVEVE